MEGVRREGERVGVREGRKEKGSEGGREYIGREGEREEGSKVRRKRKELRMMSKTLIDCVENPVMPNTTVYGLYNIMTEEVYKYACMTIFGTHTGMSNQKALIQG